uniref:Uncharacterized protein n=1 Tax=Anguilla anguilla TaxID=7936 RepID=A0A0E9UEG6_ANGAN
MYGSSTRVRTETQADRLVEQCSRFFIVTSAMTGSMWAAVAQGWQCGRRYKANIIRSKQ